MRNKPREPTDARLNGVCTMHDHPDYPDTGEPPCCDGSAVYGPGRCTCWETIYDREQAEPDVKAPARFGSECCADCAFRLDSPERGGADGYENNSAEELEEMAASRGVFYCHQGMRRILRYKHGPTGMEIEAHPASYDPPVRGSQAYCADGQPATICAGFLAEKRRLENEYGEDEDAAEEVHRS